MPRAKGGVSLEAYERWLNQGRGRGTGSLYKPWVKIREFSSRGRSNGIRGITVSRNHELFSDLEKRAFLIADFCKDVIDIREQFPLLPLDLIQVLAKQVGITYPIVSGCPWVMTTDLLLTLKGNNRYLAISVKPSSELLIKSVRDKLELERLWWNALGVDWVLATEKTLSEAVADNLVQISFPFRGENNPNSNLDLTSFFMLSNQLIPRRYLFTDLVELIAREISIDYEEAKNMLFKAIWEHVLKIDLNISIQREVIISILGWNISMKDELDVKNAIA